MKQVAIGIDIGGTNTVIGIIDKPGNVISRASIPTKTHPDYSIYLNAVTKAVKNMIKPIENEVEVLGMGLGAPNGNYYNGTIEFSPNLNFKGVVPIVDFLRSKFDFPHIILTNDANAAAMGEMIIIAGLF